MRKIVLTFGIIAGVILSAMMLSCVTAVVRGDVGFEKSEVVGYASMVLAFLLVFFGIRSYRENVGGGTITFGRAFAVGILIVVVAAVFYVATWEIVYYNFFPDFGEKYVTFVLDQMRKDGASPADIAKKTAEMARFKELYKNPFFNVAMTFMEPLPVGLIMTLISAAILRRKTPPAPAGATAMA